MPPHNRFRHQAYRCEPPDAPYRLLSSGPPMKHSSAEFAERMATAGRTFAEAGVAAIYLIHGTFAGNDGLGLFTELERVAPGAAQALRRMTKRAFNALLGETSNYIPQFAERMERSLAAGAGRTIPVRLFNWSSMNHHLARADAAVRLLDELASLNSRPSKVEEGPGRRGARGGIRTSQDPAPRVLLWAHSHGGNVLAVLTNLLAADEPTRAEFFTAARIFHEGKHAPHSGFAAWQRAEQILADRDHPLRRLAIDVVTFGTPIRYGWDAGGYSKLLHIINHRTHRADGEYAAAYPPNVRRLFAGVEGDFIQQAGIAGTNLPPLPLAYKTYLADRRLGRLLQHDLKREWLRARLKRGMRVAEDGATLLVDYADPDRVPWRHLLGHALYTRSRWLPLHATLVAEEFYVRPRPTV